MTILAPTPTTPQHTDLLTPADVLDITEALKNAAANDTTTLNQRDRQALALLTYWDACPPIYSRLFERVFDGSITLPVSKQMAGRLLDLIDRLPFVSQQDADAWLAARDAKVPCVVDQIITALALYAATRAGEEGAHLLDGALQTVIRVGKPGIPLPEVPHVADEEMVTATADLDADGLLPALCLSPVDRATHIIAARAARDTSAAPLLGWVLRTLRAELAHGGPSPISDAERYDAHDWADALIDRVRAEQQDAEYGETPAAVNA